MQREHFSEFSQRQHRSSTDLNSNNANSFFRFATPSCLPSPGGPFFCTDDRKLAPERGSPVISQNGEVPNDVLNWVISKMVWVKLWYWNFELVSSWSFFLQYSEILSFCIPLLTSENFFNGRRGVYTAAIRVTTKTVTCHSAQIHFCVLQSILPPERPAELACRLVITLYQKFDW